MSKNDNNTVWSSEQGDLHKQGNNPAPETFLPPQQQTAYPHRESKGRGGKAVTLVKNLTLSPAGMKALAKKLKAACGSGGTVKGSIIERRSLQRCRRWATKSRSPEVDPLGKSRLIAPPYCDHFHTQPSSTLISAKSSLIC